MSTETDIEDPQRTGLDSVQAGEFLRASPDPTIIIELDGTVRAVNPAVETVLGYQPGTLVGDSVAQLLPDRFHEAATNVASEYLDTGQSPVGTRDLEVFARHADGHDVPVSVTLVEHEQEGREVLTLVAREITNRLDRAAELRRERNRLASALDALAGEPGTETHSLAAIVTDAWEAVETGRETLDVDVERDVEVDVDRARVLFTAVLAATAPADGVVAVTDADDGIRIDGAAVATDLGAAPALARAMEGTIAREETSITITL